MGVSWLFLLLGMVLVVEGLVLALIPGRMEDMLAFIARTPLKTRRTFGLCTVALGVLVIWITRMLAV